MVDKHIKQLQKESSQHQLPTDTSSAINLDAPRTAPYKLQAPITSHTNQPNNNNSNPSPQTIQIPHPTHSSQPRSIHPSQHQQTIHIPQPMITRTAVRPTVILQQSPPIIPPPIPPQPQVQTPTVQAIDTSRFEAPKASAFISGDMSVECIHCRERGHKFKDCPKRAEEANGNGNGKNQQTPMEKPPLEAASGGSSSSGSDSEMHGITNNADISQTLTGMDNPEGTGMSIKSEREQKLTDLEPLRIPKKTPSEMNQHKKQNSNSNQNQQSRQQNQHQNSNRNHMVSQNVKSPPLQHRVTPQVQLINNSLNTVNSLNALNSINMMNMNMNMRSRLMNNVLMNAALHNATRRGGIAPRLINSNPLLNPLLNS